jgi:hypothetical protein
MRRRRLREALGDESGFALASVVFLGAVMIMLTALIVFRSSSQASLTASATGSDTALFVAEGGLDEYLSELALEPDPDAIDTGHSAAALADRQSIIDAARSYAASAPVTSPATVRPQPDGEAVILKPVGTKVVYSVGFYESAAAVPVRARVLSVAYDGAAGGGVVTWTADEGVLAGGDFVTGNNSAVSHLPPATQGDLHANGSVDQAISLSITGCATESVDSGYTQPNPPGCVSPTPVEPLPVVDATRMHDLSWYDLCPLAQGGAHYGPGHPVTPSGTTGVPCSGNPVGGDPPGWRRVSATLWRTTAAVTGVFYAFDMDATVRHNSAGASVIMDSSAVDPTNALNCVAFNGGGDLLQLTADVAVVAAPSTITAFGGTGIVLVSEGEVQLGNRAVATGLALAREIFDPANDASVVGPIAAVDVCGDGLDYANRFTSYYPGPVDTPFEENGGPGAAFEVLAKDEVEGS